MFITLTLLGVVVATDNNDSKVEQQTITKNDVKNNNPIKEAENNIQTDTKDEYDDENTGTGCTTTIIQGKNNDSALSFRRDATNKLTIHVKHDNQIVKQYKEGSYFFHAIVSKDGWLVGNGGADNAQVNRAIENNAMSMINKNIITSEHMNNIYGQESRLSLGHFVIKSPNGTYSLIIKNGGRVFKDNGVLQPGQYLIVPNSMNFFKKNSLTDINSESSMISSSRMITARDGFGVNRREIVTYYYKNNRVNSTVKISATNDNGKYVGRGTRYLIDNFQTDNKYFSSSDIPVLDASISLDTVNFFIRKTNTRVHTKNMTSKTGRVELTATVLDEFNHRVNNGKAIIKIDGKTLKYRNGKEVTVKVVDGSIKYNVSIPNIWSKKKHTYSIQYIGDNIYSNSRSANALVTVDKFFNIKSLHNKNIYLGSQLTIQTSIKYNNNTRITGGKVYYKINGKTILNSKNTTLFKKVNNGKAEYNYTFKDYRAKTYKITTIYINGAYRSEYNTNITLHKIPSRIISSNITLKGKIVYYKGKLVNKYSKNVKYDTYMTVKINGKTLKKDNITRKFNIRKGNINIKFTIPKEYIAKKYKITVHIPDSRQILSYTKNYALKA